MKHTRKKITVVGAGFVGSTCAHWAAAKELGDVVLVDVNEGAAKGKALDLFEASPVEQFDSRITGTSDYKDTAGSDVVIITAGIPRKPGMSRDDLLATNSKIMKEVCRGVKEYSPNSVVIVVSNPLDAMAYVAFKELGFPRERVLGMAGVLDGARFRSFIAEELNCSVKDVNAFVLGGHGDTMVPIWSSATVDGFPLLKFPGVTPTFQTQIFERTQKSGAEVISRKGGAGWAVGVAIREVIDSIALNRCRILPVSSQVDGPYGIRGVSISVPTIVGRAGVVGHIELELWPKELQGLQASARALKETRAKVK